jgi:DNA-binding CsgD family transcriptional regulator
MTTDTRTYKNPGGAAAAAKLRKHERNAEICRLVAQGMTLVQIGRVVGVSSTRVGTIAARDCGERGGG